VDGMILTRRPEFPPLVSLAWRSRSNGPMRALVEPSLDRSLPPNTTDPLAGYLALEAPAPDWFAED
jgi:hypothetical protein